MLLQPPLKAWCWCLASLGPLTVKRGAILSPHSLLWALKVKRQKCEIMNECLAVYWRFPSTQLKWESAPDPIQASILKWEKKMAWCGLVVRVSSVNERGIISFSVAHHTDSQHCPLQKNKEEEAHNGDAMGILDSHMVLFLLSCMKYSKI